MGSRPQMTSYKIWAISRLSFAIINKTKDVVFQAALPCGFDSRLNERAHNRLSFAKVFVEGRRIFEKSVAYTAKDVVVTASNTGELLTGRALDSISVTTPDFAVTIACAKRKKPRHDKLIDWTV
ncbi:hypothetical protein CTAYLR_006822 [Chrysophaeum taylorii]|uniref:Uncharacterized protein n=1 Tax=Chrysophaeum taylorii TaxID=2483200 RepID=A0AAD7UCM3_9STRA|nr:hypothetical protein CTAYLR_006822 [Chrysophaeum taylorii]